ncbi:MAG: DUF2244 domain-containing protein [Pacificimonas sp.]
MATLDLTLRPPPPMGAKAALIVLGATAAIMLFAGLRFWVVGAWMVVPFLLIDLALLIWAFRASARGSKAYERLQVTASELLLERRLPSGHRQHVTLPRSWTRVELERVSPPVSRLWLTHKGRKLLIGKHLNGREKEEVYKVIARELGSV